jgi:enamine deaminase RidA (YjgF/YER057c/UK114 family)
VDMAQHAAVMRAHREVFGDIRPATALITVPSLIDPAMIVEIEADAIIGA